MEVLTPAAMLSVLTEVSSRLSETGNAGSGVGVIAFFIQPDARFYRLSLERARQVESAVLQRLAATVRAQDRIMPLERGMWMIILPGVRTTGLLTLAMLKLEQAFDGHPVETEHLSIVLDATCGAAMSPDHGEDALYLVQSARIACVTAFRRRLAGLIYSEEMEHRSPQLASIDHDLGAAFDSDNPLQIFLQPKVRSRDGVCDGAEALLRWRRASGEWVPPAVILDAVDRLALRRRFNRWLFQRAACMLNGLNEAGAAIRLSINLSATDLYDPEVPELIEQALATWMIPSSALCVEITETNMVEESETAGVTDVLGRLRQIGVTLSIDDFGTGFSGMSRLRQFAVHEVKIDRSFVTDLARSERDREIASSIIELSHRLAISVTAEGVEDEAAAAILRELGCDHQQGYLYARAMPLDAFIEWYRLRAAVGGAAEGAPVP